MDGSACLTDTATGYPRRLTRRINDPDAPRPEACVVSPDGARVTYVRTVDGFNQVFVAAAGQ